MLKHKMCCDSSYAFPTGLRVVSLSSSTGNGLSDVVGRLSDKPVTEITLVLFVCLLVLFNVNFERGKKEYNWQQILSEDVGKREHSFTIGGIARWHSLCGHQ